MEIVFHSFDGKRFFCHIYLINQNGGIMRDWVRVGKLITDDFGNLNFDIGQNNMAFSFVCGYIQACLGGNHYDKVLEIAKKIKEILSSLEDRELTYTCYYGGDSWAWVKKS